MSDRAITPAGLVAVRLANVEICLALLATLLSDGFTEDENARLDNIMEYYLETAKLAGQDITALMERLTDKLGDTPDA